jgi:hypothetical protein
VPVCKRGVAPLVVLFTGQAAPGVAHAANVIDPQGKAGSVSRGGMSINEREYLDRWRSNQFGLFHFVEALNDRGWDSIHVTIQITIQLVGASARNCRVANDSTFIAGATINACGVVIRVEDTPCKVASQIAAEDDPKAIIDSSCDRSEPSKRRLAGPPRDSDLGRDSALG